MTWPGGATAADSSNARTLMLISGGMADTLAYIRDTLYTVSGTYSRTRFRNSSSLLSPSW